MKIWHIVMMCTVYKALSLPHIDPGIVLCPHDVEGEEDQSVYGYHDIMGLITIHLVIGVGLLILTLLVSFFSITAVMTLANLYIIVGTISFVVSIVTAIVLVTKFINHPVAHGFFSYSDILASSLLSLGLLLDGFIPFSPIFDVPCYQYTLIYSLFVVPIVTSFFSVLGMAIERFQAFAVYRDTSVMSRKFSIAWFLSSWLIAVCFVLILFGQFEMNIDTKINKGERVHYVPASQIFPGPHSKPFIDFIHEVETEGEVVDIAGMF